MFDNPNTEVVWPEDWLQDKTFQVLGRGVALGMMSENGISDARLSDVLTQSQIEKLGSAKRSIAVKRNLMQLPVLNLFGSMYPFLQFGVLNTCTFPGDGLLNAAGDDPKGVTLARWLGCCWNAELGKMQDAIASFEAEADTVPAPHKVVLAYRSALESVDRSGDYDLYLKTRFEKFGMQGQHAAVLMETARALLRLKEFETARTLLKDLADPSRMDTLEGGAAYHRRSANDELAGLTRILDGPATALAVTEQGLRERPNDIALMAQKVRFLFRSEGSRAALDYLLTALVTSPRSAVLLNCLLRMPFSKEKIRVVLDQQVRGLDASETTGSEAGALIQLGLAAQSVDRLQNIVDHWKGELPFAQLVADGKLSPGTRPVTLLNKNFSIARASNSDATLIVFPGRGNHALGVSKEVIDSFFQARNITTIYAHEDPSNLFFFGAENIGQDQADVVSYLAGLPEVKSAKRLVTLGFSGGGFLALRMGQQLKAQACVAYSAISVIGRPAPNIPDRRSERAAAQFRDLPTEDLDLLSTWPGTDEMETELVYGANVAVDRAHAERLRDKPRVSLVPDPDVVDHNSFIPRLASGEFERQIDRLLTSGAVSWV